MSQWFKKNVIMSYCDNNMLILVGWCTLKVSVSNSLSERNCCVVDCTVHQYQHIFIAITCIYALFKPLPHLVRNEEVLHRAKEEMNILHTIKRRKANWIGHILRRNCLLKHVIEGKLEGRTEMMGRRGRRRKQLLDDLKEKKRYWKLKEEALDHTLWRTRFGRGYGPVSRQTTK
jgi:hypothetical protein